MLENLLDSFAKFPVFNAMLGAGVLVFIRFLGFMYCAPVLSRKDIPTITKLSFALIFTVGIMGLIDIKAPPVDTDLFISMILNFAFGALIGFIANCIFSTIGAAGDMINMQMGLTASTMFDQNTKSQSSPVGQLFAFLATVIFINLGGLYWMFLAFKNGFTIFPLYNTSFVLSEIVNLKYMIVITSNVLFIGFQIASPVIVATLCMDLILGIISKTAPQVNVFQLSFLFKPVVGAAILLITIPIMINIINDYFVYYAKIF